MSRHDYDRMLTAFSEAAGIEDVEGLLADGDLLLDGRPARIAYVEALDICRVWVDLGESGGPPGEDFYRLLLECNFELDTPVLPVMGVHPDTRHPLLCLHLPLARLANDTPLIEVLTEEFEPLLASWTELLAEFASDAGEAEPAPPSAPPSSLV